MPVKKRNTGFSNSKLNDNTQLKRFDLDKNTQVYVLPHVDISEARERFDSRTRAGHWDYSLLGKTSGNAGKSIKRQR